MNKFLFSMLFVVGSFNTSTAQSVSGLLLDENDKARIQGATINLTNTSDSGTLHTVASDRLGNFLIDNVQPGTYTLSVSSIGYESFKKNITVDNNSLDLGTLYIPKSAKVLNEISVVSVAPPVKQKQDTVEYSANAFKVNPDANVEDLIKKMPGVTVDRAGTVTAQGETVKKVTVDGKDFFGDDATAALRNLPAEIIDKIQVFDKLSDQAAFTGFDDGNAQKSLNIVTKVNMRNGQFGRIYAGYGTDDRYSAGGNMSFFNGTRRVSLVGLFNNINQQNFSSQDLLGVTSSGGNRGGGGRGGGQGGNRSGGSGGGSGNFGGQNNFLVGQQNGISRTNAAGINFSDQWGKKFTISGSYFFNNSNNVNNQITNRQTKIGPDSTLFYNENSYSKSTNTNNRISLRLEYKIDSFNSLLVTPSLSFQNNNNGSNYTAINSYNNINPASTVSNLTSILTSGYNINNNILYRHSFAKKGRTISLGFNTSFNRKTGDTYQQGVDKSYDNFNQLLQSDSVQQYTDVFNHGYTISPNVSYTEPVGKKGQLQLNYNPSFTTNKADQETYQYDYLGKNYSLFDSSLSNKFDNTYNTHNTGVTYRVGDRDNQFSVGVSYQYSELASDQKFPNQLSIDKTFSNVLPNLQWRKKLSAKSSIRIFYRTAVNSPSVNQLQNVINLNNPLLQTTGNPNLKQQYSSTLATRYTFTNTLKGQSFFANIFLQQVDKYIAEGTYIASNDSVLTTTDTLKRGSQIIKPVNLDGYWNVRSFLTFGMPLKFIKTNLNANAGFTYSKLPGLINNVKSITNNYTYSAGAVLASNISEYIDFNLSYNANINVVAEQRDNNFLTQTAGVQFNLLTKNGWFFQNDLNNESYNYKSSSIDDQNFWLWNISAGKKFLKDQKGELKLSVFDLLKQNKSITRTVTGTYIEDVQSQVLRQYFMLTFTYKLKNFGTAAARSLNNNNRPPGNPPGL